MEDIGGVNAWRELEEAAGGKGSDMALANTWHHLYPFDKCLGDG
jgi:hypothetical protein